MPPEPRVVPRFAAEPPQEDLPYGRWAQRLEGKLLPSFQSLADEEQLGGVGEIAWYPDRGWQGQTYVPASAYTTEGFQLFGYVRFARLGREQDEPTKTDEPRTDDGSTDRRESDDGGAPDGMAIHADFTEQTAERNPSWRLDLCEQPIGTWRGPNGQRATMTLVWGRPLVGSGRLVTAELGGVTVDQCELIEQRFTLIAPDDYQHDLLEIELWGAKGQELARESLYEG